MRSDEHIHLIGKRQARFRRILNNLLGNLVSFTLQTAFQCVRQFGHNLFSSFTVYAALLRHRLEIE